MGSIIPLLLALALQEPPEAEQLFRRLTDDSLEAREQATRTLIERYDHYRDAVERRFQLGSRLDPDELARLADVRRQGPPALARRRLQNRLDRTFRERNAESLETLFGGDEEALVKAVDAIYRRNRSAIEALDTVECLLYAFHRSRAMGWREGLRASEGFLVQNWPRPSREGITVSIREAFKDPDTEVVWRAVRLLARAGKDAAPELRKFLEHPRPIVRRVALEGLTPLLTPEDAPAVARFLKDADASTRQTAIRSLVELKAADHADAIGELVDDPSYSVRRTAVDALGRLRSHKHAPRLVTVLAEVVPGGADARSWAFEDLLQAQCRPRSRPLREDRPHTALRPAPP